MMKHEFEVLVKEKITDEEWKVIETVLNLMRREKGGDVR